MRICRPVLRVSFSVLCMCILHPVLRTTERIHRKLIPVALTAALVMFLCPLRLLRRFLLTSCLNDIW